MKKLVLLSILTISCFMGCERSMNNPISERVSRDDPEAYTLYFVQTAIDFYNRNGIEATIEYYNDPSSIDGQWYIFVIDKNDLVIVAPINPQFLGTNIREEVRPNGSTTAVDIANATEEGVWVEHDWISHLTGKREPRRTWAIRYDGYIFGSGYSLSFE